MARTEIFLDSRGCFEAENPDWVKQHQNEWLKMSRLHSTAAAAASKTAAASTTKTAAAAVSRNQPSQTNGTYVSSILQCIDPRKLLVISVPNATNVCPYMYLAYFPCHFQWQDITKRTGVILADYYGIFTALYMKANGTVSFQLSLTSSRCASCKSSDSRSWTAASSTATRPTSGNRPGTSNK